MKPTSNRQIDNNSQKPVCDFFDHLARQPVDLPLPAEPIEDTIARVRRNFEAGEDFLVEMHDGSGPRLASEVLEDVLDPERWSLMLARIDRNLEHQDREREGNTWPRQV